MNAANIFSKYYRIFGNIIKTLFCYEYTVNNLATNTFSLFYYTNSAQPQNNTSPQKIS